MSFFLRGGGTDIMTYTSTDEKILQPEALKFQISFNMQLFECMLKKHVRKLQLISKCCFFHLICLTLAIYYECLIYGSSYLEKKNRNVDKKLHNTHIFGKIYIQAAFALASVGR